MIDVHQLAAGSARQRITGPIHALRFLAGAASARWSPVDTQNDAAMIPAVGLVGYRFNPPLPLLVVKAGASEALVCEVATSEGFDFAAGVAPSLPLDAAGGVAVDNYNSSRPLVVAGPAAGPVVVGDAGTPLTPPGARCAELATIADVSAFVVAAWTVVPGSEFSVPSWVKALQFVCQLKALTGTWGNWGLGVDWAPDSANYLKSASGLLNPTYYGTTLVAPYSDAGGAAGLNPEVATVGGTLAGGPFCNINARPGGKVRLKYYMGTVGSSGSMGTKIFGWG